MSRLIFQYVLSQIHLCYDYLVISSHSFLPYHELNLGVLLTTPLPGQLGFGSVGHSMLSIEYILKPMVHESLKFLFLCFPVNITTFLYLLYYGNIPWCSSVGIFSMVTLKKITKYLEIFFDIPIKQPKKCNPLYQILTFSKKDLYSIKSSFSHMVFRIFFGFDILMYKFPSSFCHVTILNTLFFNFFPSLPSPSTREFITSLSLWRLYFSTFLICLMHIFDYSFIFSVGYSFTQELKHRLFYYSLYFYKVSNAMQAHHKPPNKWGFNK